MRLSVNRQLRWTDLDFGIFPECSPDLHTFWGQSPTPCPSGGISTVGSIRSRGSRDDWSGASRVQSCQKSVSSAVLHESNVSSAETKLGGGQIYEEKAGLVRLNGDNPENTVRESAMCLVEWEGDKKSAGIHATSVSPNRALSIHIEATSHNSGWNGFLFLPTQ